MSWSPEDDLPAPIDRDDFDTEEDYEDFLEDLADRRAKEEETSYFNYGRHR